jgi:hypothetical protein
MKAALKKQTVPSELAGSTTFDASQAACESARK